MADSSINLGIKITADGANANATISTLTKNIEKVGDSSKKAAAGVDSISRSAKALSGAAMAAGKALAAMGAYLSVRQLAQTADAYSNLNARIKLVSGTTNELVKAQKELFALSQRNMTPLADTVNLYSRLAYAMRDMGRSQAETLQMVDLLGKSLRISGASAGEMASVLQQLSQALGGGVLRGEEFNALRENGQRTLRALADGLGVTVGQLKNLADQGKLTSDVVTKALLSQADTLKREYATMPVTISGAFQQIGNAFTQYIGQTDQSSGASRKFAESLTTIAQNMDKIMAPVASVTSFVVGAFAKWADAIEKVKTATAGLRDMLAKVIPDMDGLAKRHQVIDLNGYSTGGGFGGANDAGEKAFFDGVNRGTEGAAKSYIAAANAAWKLNDAQKAVVATIVKIGEAQGFDPAFLLSIAKAETQLGNMKRLVSPTGAQGIFQFMPATAKAMGVADPFNLEQATNGAIKYLGKLKNEFKSVNLAAAGYNAGEGAVRKYGGNVPPYKETQTYVRRVLQNMQELQSAMGKSTDDIGKDLAKAEKDQFDAYQAGLNQREKAYDDYSKVALAKNKTLMDQLAIRQKDVGEKSTVAASMGDMEALKRAEAEAKQLILDRNKATLESIGIEERAINKRLGNIGMEIAAAKQLKQFTEVAKLESERSTDKANLQALAETRKQLELQTNSDLLQSAKDYADKRLQLDKGLADANVAMAQERRQAEADALQLQYQAAEFSQQQLQANIDDQKAALDATVAQTKAQIALNEEQRAQALEGKTGLEAIAQQRENINGKLRDALTLIQAEKQAALDKLNLDQQMLDYEAQIAEWKKTNAQDAVTRLQAETAIADIHNQQAANAQKYLDVLAGVAVAETKARTEAAKASVNVDAKEVRESMLRMNAIWDQTIDRMKQAGEIWRELLGSQEEGFGNIALSLAQYGKSLDQITDKYDELAKSGKDMDANGNTRLKETAQATAQAVGSVALGMRKMMKEGTDGYKAMTAMAGAAAIAQDALNISDGIAAILKQLKDGDVYTAIPRAIAVGAMVMQLIGHAISVAAAVGGGGRPVTAEDRQKTQGTGTIFGDASAQSNSIANSLAVIKENSSADLTYSAEMLRAMEDLSESILALANRVTLSVMPAIDAAIKQSGMKFGMQRISLFSGFKKELTDSGIGWFETQLSDILKGSWSVQLYADITKSFEAMGQALSSSTKTYVATAGSEITNSVTRIFKKIIGAFQEGAKAFGLTGNNVLQALQGFTVKQTQISLKDLNMEEQAQALNAVFSSITDEMATVLNQNLGLGLEPFIKAGEGMSQTFMRVANDINVATGLLAQAGLEVINYRKIINKQGDVSAELVRQSIVQFEGFDTALGRYINQAVGTAEDLLTVYDSLLQIREIAPFVALNFENLSNTMIVAAGGVSAFLKAVQTYQQQFRPGTQLVSEIMMLQGRMAKLGKTMPTSRDGFIALVEGVDTSTEAGQRLYAQLIKLAGAFDSVFDQIDNADELLKKYLPTDALSGFRDQIRQVGDDFKTIIATTLATLPGGAEFMSLSQQKKNVTENLITKQTNQAATWAKLDLVNEELLTLQAKDKLTKEEKKRLQVLRGERRTLTATLREVTDDVAKYKAQLAKIDEKLAKNPGSAQLATKRAELIEQQGDALIKTISDIWDQMTQAINAAKETLKSIQDSIFELAGGAGSENIKLGMANARRISAESAYNAYSGNDINQLNKLASDYYRAIMDEYNAKMELIEAPKKALEKERELRQKAHDEEISALEKTLGKTKELNDAIKAIQKYALDLKLGSQSTLSPEQRLAEAQKQYAALLARAQGGDVTAMQELASGASSYLDAAQKYYGSNSQYATIFDGVQKAMESLGAMNPGDADSIQAKIDQLNKDHEIYLKSIDEQIAALNIDQQIKDLQAATVAKLQRLADDLGPRITEAEKQAAEDMKTLIAEIMSSNVFNERQLDTLREIAKSMGITLPVYTGGGGGGGGSDPRPGTDIPKYDGPAAYKSWNAYWRQELRTLKGHPEWGMTWAEYKAQEYNRLKAQGMHPILPNFAAGGLAQAGMALVGEKGPELVSFSAPARVIPADETRKILTGGDDAKIAEAIRELKEEMRAVVVTQSRANPQIIEKLSNMEERLSQIERTQRLKA